MGKKSCLRKVRRLSGCHYRPALWKHSDICFGSSMSLATLRVANLKENQHSLYQIILELISWKNQRRVITGKRNIQWSISGVLQRYTDQHLWLRKLVRWCVESGMVGRNQPDSLIRGADCNNFFDVFRNKIIFRNSIPAPWEYFDSQLSLIAVRESPLGFSEDLGQRWEATSIIQETVPWKGAMPNRRSRSWQTADSYSTALAPLVNCTA